MSSTITVALAATPGPSARITITGIVGAASVQIFRGDGTQEVRVAGDDQQIPAGGIFMTDYRLPPGRTVTYRAVLYSSLGAITESISAAALSVPALDPTYGWVMDPEDPTNAMLLQLMDSTGDTVGHQSRGVAVQPLKGLPIWLGGPRMNRSRAFIVTTSSVADSTQFQQIIEPGGALLFRPSTTMRHDTGLIYIGAPSIPEAPRPPYVGPTDWTIEGTEVADDNWPTIVVERTWADVKAAYATWADVKAAYATWLDVKKGP